MYTLWLVLGFVGCALSLAAQFGWTWKNGATALVTTTAATLCGVLAAKLAYVLLMADTTLAAYGAEALWFTDVDSFSVFGGAAGAVLSACATAKLLGMRPAAMLDRFIPSLALGLTFLRLSEGELGTLGVGAYVEPGGLWARFPFAVGNAYGEYYLAVFALEALFALLCAVALWRRGRAWSAGLKAEIGLFLLALPQIFCESLRARCMKWGFVRVEQLLCCLLLLGLLGHACNRAREWRRLRFLPLALGVLAVGGIGGLEYAMDKTDLPIWVCYGLLWVMLGLLAGAELAAVRQREGASAVTQTAEAID